MNKLITIIIILSFCVTATSIDPLSAQAKDALRPQSARNSHIFGDLAKQSSAGDNTQDLIESAREVAKRAFGWADSAYTRAEKTRKEHLPKSVKEKLYPQIPIMRFMALSYEFLLAKYTFTEEINNEEDARKALFIVNHWMALFSNWRGEDTSEWEAISASVTEEDKTAINRFTENVKSEIEELSEFASARSTPILNREIDINYILTQSTDLSIKNSTDFSQDLPPVIGDDILLRFAFEALFKEAESDMIGDTPKQLKISTKLLDDQDIIEIRINYAIEQSSEYLPHLLDPYFDTYYTWTSSGSIPPLQIAKGVMELHKGSIRIESDKSTGTTFIIHLPCAKPVEVVRVKAEALQADIESFIESAECLVKELLPCKPLSKEARAILRKLYAAKHKLKKAIYAYEKRVDEESQKAKNKNLKILLAALSNYIGHANLYIIGIGVDSMIRQPYKEDELKEREIRNMMEILQLLRNLYENFYKISEVYINLKKEPSPGEFGKFKIFTPRSTYKYPYAMDSLCRPIRLRQAPEKAGQKLPPPSLVVAVGIDAAA